jgi:hypothetical protein
MPQACVNAAWKPLCEPKPASSAIRRVVFQRTFVQGIASTGLK